MGRTWWRALAALGAVALVVLTVGFAYNLGTMHPGDALGGPWMQPGAMHAGMQAGAMHAGMQPGAMHAGGMGGYGYGRMGWGAGFFPFHLIGTIFLVVLGVGLLRLVFRPHWGGPWMHAAGPWVGPGGWREQRRAMLEEWHREAHAAPVAPAGPTAGDTPAGDATRTPEA